MTRLEQVYSEKVVPALQKEFGYKSPMQIPKFKFISLNIGLGEASQNSKLIDEAVAELTAIAGQKSVITRAKKSIAAFKLRENQPVGCRVTLHHVHLFHQDSVSLGEDLQDLADLALVLARDDNNLVVLADAVRFHTFLRLTL